MVSKKFIETIKLHERPAYKIAQDAGLSQATLSQIMNGICTIQDNDERVLAVGKVLGIEPDDCFDK